MKNFQPTLEIHVAGRNLREMQEMITLSNNTKGLALIQQVVEM